MTPDNFCYWLQGFFEISEAVELSADQLREIKNHTNLVLASQPENYHVPTPSADSPIALPVISGFRALNITGWNTEYIQEKTFIIITQNPQFVSGIKYRSYHPEKHTERLLGHYGISGDVNNIIIENGLNPIKTPEQHPAVLFVHTPSHLIGHADGYEGIANIGRFKEGSALMC